VLEVGPGDSDGVALRLLAAGASEVTLIERVALPRDRDQQRRIRRGLLDSLARKERKRLTSIVHPDGSLIESPRLRWITGTGIDDADHLLTAAGYDLILSMAVLQEVRAPDAAFAAMDRALAPGGAIVHGIDLRDYGHYSGRGLHPLTYLTIPEPIYRASAYVVRVNRRHMAWYRAKTAELGYRTVTYASRVVGQDRPLPRLKTELREGVDYDERAAALVEEIRPKLRRRYRSAPVADLLTAGIVLVATKPPAPRAAPGGR
jgi:SAM-dependent methyltransferase